MHCRVFQDDDESGTWDVGETFVPGVHLTNGRHIFTTDSTGFTAFAVDRAEYRFATMTIPAGYLPTTSWYHWVPVGDAGPDTVDFGLRLCPESARGVSEICWIHIADTQVQGPGEPYDMAADLEALDALPDRPLFIMNAGDLVEVGSDTTHWNNYVNQLAVSEHVVFPVVGNHDVIPTAEPMANYERWAGPPYYSIDAGDWHFVVYSGFHFWGNEGTPQQDAWLAEDLAARQPGTHTAMFQHYTFQETNPQLVSQWVAAGITSCFSGHWHSNQFADHAGFTDYNLSWLRNGAVDRTSRCAGIVRCTIDGRVIYERRRMGVHHRSSIVWPEAFQTVGREAVEVVINAYDTVSRVSGVSATLSAQGNVLGPIPLAREGPSMWRALIDASALLPGTYTLGVSGSFDDDTQIALLRQVVLDDVVPIQRSPTTDWPMFRRCSAGSSFVALTVPPPLELAWSAQVPGMVALSSPVVAGGNVVLGCRAEREVSESGVISCNAVTGAVNWFTRLPTGVALAPAVAEGIVIATTMSDSTYGLDARTGARVWALDQVEPRFTTTAPIFEGTRAWVGTEPRPRQIQCATGSHEWYAPNIGSPWYPLMYSAPAVTPDYVHFGFFGWSDPASGGYKVLSRLDGSLVHNEGGAWRSPLCTPDYVYVVGALDRNNEFLTARDAAGNVIWTASKNLGTGVGAPAIAHGILVVPGRNGAIEAFQADDGTNLWTKTVDPQLYAMEVGWGVVRATNSTPAIADSVVYVGSNDGRLYALDLFTGAELWRWEAGVPISSSPAISGNMVFVATEDEHLYAFAARAGGGASTSPNQPATGPSFGFSMPSPNPTVAGTRFAFSLSERGRAALRVFDVRGRLLRTILDEVTEAGSHTIEWDGTDARGAAVMPGVYFAQLKAGSHVAVQKVVRLSP